MHKRILLIGCMALGLLGCNAAAGQLSAAPAAPEGAGNSPTAAITTPAVSSPNRDTTGSGGGAAVKVSAGIVLLTPGAPLPAPDLGLPTAPASSDVAAAEPGATSPLATPAPTIDLSSIELPDQLPVYPGAFNVIPPGEEMGVTYISFDTTDTPEQVLAFYAEKIAAAGWQPVNEAEHTLNPSGKNAWSWMKDGSVLNVVTSPKGSSTNVVLTWL